MKVLVLGLSIFCIAFSIHLVLWKIRIPQYHIKALLQIFLGTLLAALAVLALNAHLYFLLTDLLIVDHPALYFHIALLFVALMLFYIVTYTALEVDSPSLIILCNIKKAGAQGLPKEKILESMTNDTLVMPRLNDLLRDGLAVKTQDRYQITDKGKFVRIFILYRRLLGITAKGG